MSQENVEVVQRAVEAWNADDLDAFLAELHADLEWHPSIEPGLEGTATIYRGHDGAQRLGGSTAARHGNDSRVGLRRFATSASRSCCSVGSSSPPGRQASSSARRSENCLSFEGGKIVRARDFLTHAEALEAAGLSE